MNDPKTKQDNLNRLYSQILRIDEDGKDFLKNILTQAATSRDFPGMPPSTKVLPDESKPEPGLGR